MVIAAASKKLGKTGKERPLVGIIGYPIEHSLSPELHNAAFKALNLNWLYLAFAVKPKAVKAAVNGLKALNFAGFNVTLPHKQAVAKLVDELKPEAQLAQAVNTVKIKDEKLIGYNTDISGFLASLNEVQFNPKGKVALLIGAGGAAFSVAVALAQAKIAKIMVLNRTLKKAEKLKGRLKQNFSLNVTVVKEAEDVASFIDEVNLVVNATSVGMQNNPGLPLPQKFIKKGQVIYDLIYAPVETELIRLAKAKGCQSINGLSMLVHQGAKAFEIWTGQKAPLEIMKQAVSLNASN
jgi:shikimate dehydrogenase